MKQTRYLYRFICCLILTAVMVVTFAYVWSDFINHFQDKNLLLGKGNFGMSCLIYMAIFLLLGTFLNVFKIGVERKTKLLASVVLAIVLTDMIDVFISMAIFNNFRFGFSILWRFMVLAIVQSILCGALALLMVNIYRRLVPPICVLVVDGKEDDTIEHKINAIFHKYRVGEVVPPDCPADVLREKAKRYDAVLINDVPAQTENMIVKMCFDMDKRVYLIPKISDIIIKGSEDLNVMDTPLYLCRNLGVMFWNRALKRFFDIVLSGTALVALCPVLVVTAFLIKKEDGGPVFFRQERVTRGGRRFQILKFRSMIVDAEKDGRPHPAGVKDDRITRVGRFIRAYRIDELPQLINIFIGDMSIVGLRPERWEHVEKYKHEIPEFVFREKVKGGLTGYAQVYGKYNTTALDKLKLDLMYITNLSIILDLQIIFETAKILFQKESTEGFSEARVREMHDQSPTGSKEDRNDR